ncbi:hypothetical protein LTS18_013193, partial [Coniosporium uncinatum]
SELRDLFTLDESGKCMTHELLACDCGGMGNVAAPAEAIDDDVFIEGDNADEPQEVLDSDDELPAVGMIKASRLDWQEQERKIEEKKRSRTMQDSGKEMLALMQYLHIDGAPFQGRQSVKTVQALGTPDSTPAFKAEPLIKPEKPHDNEEETAETNTLCDEVLCETYADGTKKSRTDVNGRLISGENDIANSELDELVEDKALLHCLKEEGGRIGFVFARTTS